MSTAERAAMVANLREALEALPAAVLALPRALGTPLPRPARGRRAAVLAKPAAKLAPAGARIVAAISRSRKVKASAARPSPDATETTRTFRSYANARD